MRRPSSKTAIREATRAMRARSWPTTKSPSPRSAARRCKSAKTRAAARASSEAAISSAKSQRGETASARARAARWRSPPESACGRRCAKWAGSPTSSKSSAARRRASPRLAPKLPAASATMGPKRRCGWRLRHGSCGPYCTAANHARPARPGTVPSSAPPAGSEHLEPPLCPLKASKDARKGALPRPARTDKAERLASGKGQRNTVQDGRRRRAERGRGRAQGRPFADEALGCGKGGAAPSP